MSPNPMTGNRKPSRSVWAALTLASSLLLAGCVFGSTWEGPVPIDPALWEIEVTLCGQEERFMSNVASGFVINVTDERSPVYDIGYRITFTDGHIEERVDNLIIPPIDPGEKGEFWFFLLGDEDFPRTVETCEFWVTDAIENHL